MASRPDPEIIEGEFTVVDDQAATAKMPARVERPKTWADAITAIIVVAIIRAIVTHFIHN